MCYNRSEILSSIITISINFKKPSLQFYNIYGALTLPKLRWILELLSRNKEVPVLQRFTRR